MADRFAWWIQTVVAAVVLIALAAWIVRHLIMRRQTRKYLKEIGLEVNVLSHRDRVIVEVKPTTGEVPVNTKETNNG
jgi:hypothetical protein